MSKEADLAQVVVTLLHIARQSGAVFTPELSEYIETMLPKLEAMRAVNDERAQLIAASRARKVAEVSRRRWWQW